MGKKWAYYAEWTILKVTATHLWCYWQSCRRQLHWSPLGGAVRYNGYQCIRPLLWPKCFFQTQAWCNWRAAIVQMTVIFIATANLNRGKRFSWYQHKQLSPHRRKQALKAVLQSRLSRASSWITRLKNTHTCVKKNTYHTRWTRRHFFANWTLQLSSEFYLYPFIFLVMSLLWDSRR